MKKVSLSDTRDSCGFTTTRGAARNAWAKRSRKVAICKKHLGRRKIDVVDFESLRGRTDLIGRYFLCPLVDLLPHHEIPRYEDPYKIFNEGGAMEVMVPVKQAGKVRLSDSEATKILTYTFICSMWRRPMDWIWET